MRLIDADKVVPLVRLLLLYNPLADTICEQVQKLVDIHTIDAVPVVRCKDCEYRGKLYRNNLCDHPKALLSHVTDTDFCSYGERRSHHDSLCDQNEEENNEET